MQDLHNRACVRDMRLGKTSVYECVLTRSKTLRICAEKLHPMQTLEWRGDL